MYENEGVYLKVIMENFVIKILSNDYSNHIYGVIVYFLVEIWKNLFWVFGVKFGIVRLSFF